MQTMLRTIAIALVAALIIALCISISMYANMHQQNESVRNRFGEAVYQNLYMLLRKSDELTLAGADIQGSVLPAMREYYLSACVLDEALGDAYGIRYSVMSSDYVAGLGTSFSDYEAALRGGRSTDQTRDALIAVVRQIEPLLLNRYDERGRLLPSS